MLRVGLWTGAGVGILFGALPLLALSALSSSETAFERTWERTDRPVADGVVSRTWMWGPTGHTEAFYEPYADAPDGLRKVKYFDKSRMEINDPDADPSSTWYVTNGLLARELITGEMQTGDTSFEYRAPASVHVAGDGHPDSPTYATFGMILDAAPLPVESVIVQTIDRDGTVGERSDLARHQVVAEHYVSYTDHIVASVFWEFMNSTGEVSVEGDVRSAPLFENPFFAVGFPLTEAYWAHVPVGGEWRDVLVQCFERRCLTYTPDNPEGWKVEAANIGQHYYNWRYEKQAESPEPTASPIPPEPPHSPSPTPPANHQPPPVPSPTETPAETPVPVEPAPPQSDEECEAAEQATLIGVTDGLGNANPNSWARGTGGDWPGGLDASPTVAIGVTLNLSVQADGECGPFEYRFQRHRAGGASEVIRGWSQDPDFSYTLLDSDSGQHFMIIVDVRDQDPRTRFDDRDDYTYLTYVVH